MSLSSHGICFQCDDPVVVGPTGWYRCRWCGYESIRTNSAEFGGQDVCVRVGGGASGASDNDARGAGLGLLINKGNGRVS